MKRKGPKKSPREPVVMLTPEQLVERLKPAVAAHVRGWQGWPADSIVRETRACGQALASSGDLVLWPPEGKGREARLASDTFYALARGLAGLSFAPGGVDFLGVHWEAP